MIEHSHLCLGCMSIKGDAKVCPFCNWKEGTDALSPQHLQPGSILHHKYLIGKALGQGGFGITYLAYDLQLEMKLAIKEYMPRDFATRHTGNKEISVFTGDYKTHYDHGLKKFLEEAKILAKYSTLPGIISVKDYFEENNTAYLVMYYLEGIDLKNYLEQLGGKTSFDIAISILMPIMDALKVIHKDGLLHRDVSPDNIYVTSTGDIKLLDFGAARHAFHEQNRSMSVILKPGYAPEEQYRSRGRQGPWTDVYAVAATLYRMIVGQIPPDSLDRLERDTLLRPSSLGVQIPPHAEMALMTALSIRGQDRFQSIEEFQNALTNPDWLQNMSVNSGQRKAISNLHPQSTNQTLPLGHVSGNHYLGPNNNIPPVNSQVGYQNRNEYPSPSKKDKTGLIIGFVIGGIALIGILFFVLGNLLNQEQPVSQNTPGQNTPGQQPPNTNEGNPNQNLGNQQGGNQVTKVQIPNLYNLTEKEAVNQLTALGLKPNVNYTEYYIVRTGRVYDQDYEAGTEIESDSTFNIYVNQGPELLSADVIYKEGFEVIKSYYNEAIEYYYDGDRSSALRALTQAYEMGLILYEYNGDETLYESIAGILLDSSIIKEELGEYYYAYEDAIEAADIYYELYTNGTLKDYSEGIASSYSYTAKYQLLIYDVKNAITNLELSLDYYATENAALYLGYAYMLNEQFDEAYTILSKIWVNTINGKSGQEVILKDFEILQSVGYPTSIIDEMKNALMSI